MTVSDDKEIQVQVSRDRRSSKTCVPYFPPSALFVFILGLATRITLIVQAEANELVSPDTPSYLDPARAFLDRWQFLVEKGSEQFMYVRTPGYPLLLSGAMAVVGDDVKRIALIQALFSSFLILACYLLTRRMVGQTVALVVAACVAFDPLLIYSSGRILTESPHAVALLFVGVSLFLIARNQTSKYRYWFLVGLAVAAATMIRPTTYYLPIILFVAGALLLWQRGSNLRQAAKCLIVGLAPFLLIVGGWQVRNDIRVGSSRFSGIEAVNMYFYRGGGILAEQQGRPFGEVLRELQAEYPDTKEEESQGRYYDRMYDQGLEIVSKNVPQFAIIAAKAIPRITLGESGMFLDYAGIPRNGLTVWGLRLLNLVIWLVWAATICIAVFLPRWRGTVLALSIPTIYVVLISAGAEAYSRFRTPVMPLVYLVCGIGLAIGRDWLLDRRNGDQQGGLVDPALVSADLKVYS